MKVASLKVSAITLVMALWAACSMPTRTNVNVPALPTQVMASPTPMPMSERKPPVEVDLTINGVRSGDEEATIIAKMGKPSSTKKGEFDECAYGYHRELKYDGLTFDLLSDEHRKRYAVTRMEVTSLKWQISPGVHIGDSKEKVREVFGEPVSQDSDSISYVTKGNEGWVSFYFKDDKLVKATMAETLC